MKTDAGVRTVPPPARVRRALAEHMLRTGRSGGDLLFGCTPDLPFTPSTVRARALKAWADSDVVMPHEARHCAMSYFHKAGVTDKELSLYAGHSDVRTTLNVYVKPLEGHEAQSAAKVDALLGEVASA